MTRELPESSRSGRGFRRAVTAAMLAVTAAACDFDVSNPGPVEDRILNDPTSHTAVVNGAARAVSDAVSSHTLQTSAATREVHASGNTGTISVEVGQGRFIPEQGGLWASAQRARWIGDDAVRRLGEVAAAPGVRAQAHLWAGFASRLAGDNLCHAVIDGGPSQPHTVFLERAVQHFTQAIDLAGGDENLALAARAGRATVHMSLGNWSAAVADARQIPLDFVFHARYSAEEPSQRNEQYFYVANAPYRATSVWGTAYEQYFLDTGDPRTPWSEDARFPVGEVQRPGIGNVPWKFQKKYQSYNDGIRLVSGREMRLIEAEALLVSGDWETAMQIVNGIRTLAVSTTNGQPLEPWSATSLTEAWTRLKRERGIELWIEGRRLSDLRRWEAANRPGALHPLEDATNPGTFLSPDRTLCVPISLAEIETNRNLGG
jgi:starch-binding outer membrane protein, SusD/RagB family